MKRDAIIEEAEQLFAEKGYEGASVRELAARAGINIAMISYYFGSKEELFKAIVERRTTEIREYLEALSRDRTLDPLTKLERYIDNYLDRRFANRSFYRILQLELSLERQSEVRDYLSSLLLRNCQELRKIIRQGQCNGVFADVDIDMTIATVIGVVNQVMNSDTFACKILHADRSDTRAKERIAAHLKTLLRSLLLRPDGVTQTAAATSDAALV